MSARRLLRVGLTGGIASGKSHVLRRLAAAGFATIDLDRVGHEVIGPRGAALADIVSAFGPSVVDVAGGVDRKALGAIVGRITPDALLGAIFSRFCIGK